ncbi:MAG: DUF1836 domain-containing protein [Firmicutes bacterium]|nr:DUF1836 domain-containing protein [Bacillota bacterium]
MRYEEYVKTILDDYVNKGRIQARDFPDMELYMDQAAMYMNKKLEIYQKADEEPVMTKAMISNYVKHDMLPKPNKKKYSRDHLAMLTLVFYLKGVLQVQDIENLMKPLIDNYNSEFEEHHDLLKLYNGIENLYHMQREDIVKEVNQDIDDIKKFLSKYENADDDVTELFMLISLLAMKADAQRYMVQKLMDEYFTSKK